MRETLDYIKVLNWGYGGFAPMALNQDFEKSLQQAQERLELLESLNYDALFVEATSANGKKNLQKYQRTENSFEYSLHFMRDKQILLDAIPTMFKCFKDGADKLKADGVWTFEQWREYRVTLSQIERGFEDRLRQFATAYDFSLDSDNHNSNQSPKPEEPKPLTIKNTEREMNVFSKAIEKEYMEFVDGCYKWKLSKSLLAYMCGRLYCGDRIKEDDADYSEEYVKGGTQMPAKEVEALFGVDVASNRYSIKAPPRNHWKVDELF